jgi:hypothetical protein
MLEKSAKMHSLQRRLSNFSESEEPLCIGAFLYAYYSLLLISNKFCNGGGQCGNVTLPHWRGGGSSVVK